METIVTVNTIKVTFKGISFTRLFDNFWTALYTGKKTEFYEILELKDGFIKIYLNEDNTYKFVYYSYKWLFA